jgi:hypothetical protein
VCGTWNDADFAREKIEEEKAMVILFLTLVVLGKSYGANQLSAVVRKGSSGTPCTVSDRGFVGHVNRQEVGQLAAPAFSS